MSLLQREGALSIYKGARCRHVPECGGCSCQQFDYAEQIRSKEERLHALFSGLAPVRPLIPCEDPWRYRNKMEFSFSQNKAGDRFLGLIIAKSRGYVLNLHECHLVAPWFIEVVQAVYCWWEKSGLAAYRLNDTGSLRTLIVREGAGTGDKLVMLTVSGNPQFALKKEHMQEFVRAVQSIAPTASIFLRVQQIRKGCETQFFEMHLAGADHLTEKCFVAGREYTFKISPSSFFQPNTHMAEKIYTEVLQRLPAFSAHILDLYSGIGTLGIIAAERAKLVSCIELNPYAVYDAECNREQNGAAHCLMYKGDVGKVLSTLQNGAGWIAPDVVIVDPPRSGLDKHALKHLVDLRPKEIIYISCHAATQKENCLFLAQEGYVVDSIQPLDQFPHTVHVETIAHLKTSK